MVWNVVATPEFSVHPQHWCFPVAGCVAYRGYFHERRAREFAADLALRGDDVAVEGVPAYSTLGRFADPVLSSMLPYGDDELAATIFHELAHQLLYVRDDSEFNEAFAITVEDAGLERWLAVPGRDRAHAGVSRRPAARAGASSGCCSRTRARLAALYASGVAAPQMRARKAAIFAVLAADMRALEQRDGEHYALFDEWIAAGLNNARLASVATYYDCVPGFRQLLAAQGGDLHALLRGGARTGEAAARGAPRTAVRHGGRAARRTERQRVLGERAGGRAVPRYAGSTASMRARLDAERRAAVLAADAVAGERAEVVERERLAGQQPHHHALHARQRIRQRQQVAGKSGHACGEAHDLLQRQHLRTAQLVGRAGSGARRCSARTHASATSNTLTGAKRAPARASGNHPPLRRSSCAKRLVSESSGPKITEGRKMVTAGCALSACGAARSSASAAPLERR